MKNRLRLAIGLVAVLGSLLVSAGIAYAITDGQPDEGAHPYVGLIVVDDEDGPAWRCSGFLIADDVVLTAGHCTDGAVAARVWFSERLQDEDGNYLVPDYPEGGVVAVEGAPYTNPDYCNWCYGPSNGLPAWSYRDVGVVILDDPVYMDEYAELPEAGQVDTLKNKAAVDLVGYGVQWKEGTGIPPWDRWTGLRTRLFAPSQLVSGKFVHSDEYLRFSENPGGGKGGSCYGDSGSPILLGGTHTVLAVTSYGYMNPNCTGVAYAARVDIPEVLEWINGFLIP